MLIITEEKLELLLEQYHGRLVSKSTDQYPPFFANPKSAFDRRLEISLQFNMTDVSQNFNQHYNKTHSSTFPAFLRWIAIKAMHDSACTYRLINGQCYEFDNLPLELSVKTNDKRDQAVYYLDEVTHSTWNSFCRRYAYYVRAPMENDATAVLPIDAIAHQLIGLPSNPSQKSKYAHQPVIWFRELYSKESDTFLSVHVSFSQATMTPEIAMCFLQKFEAYAKLKPAEIQALFPVKKANEKEIITDIIDFDFLKQNKHYAPDYDSTSDNIEEHNANTVGQLALAEKDKNTKAKL